MTIAYIDLQPTPPSAHPSGSLCRMYGRIVDMTGDPARFVRVEFVMAGASTYQPALHPHLSITSLSKAVSTDVGGNFQIDLLRGLPVLWKMYPDAFFREMVVPDDDVVPFFDYALPRPIYFGWKTTVGENDPVFSALPAWEGDAELLFVALEVSPGDSITVEPFVMWSNGEASYPGNAITVAENVNGAVITFADGVFIVSVDEDAEDEQQVAVIKLNTALLNDTEGSIYTFAGWSADGTLSLVPAATFALQNLPELRIVSVT